MEEGSEEYQLQDDGANQLHIAEITIDDDEDEEEYLPNEDLTEDQNAENFENESENTNDNNHEIHEDEEDALDIQDVAAEQARDPTTLQVVSRGVCCIFLYDDKIAVGLKDGTIKIYNQDLSLDQQYDVSLNDEQSDSDEDHVVVEYKCLCMDSKSILAGCNNGNLVDDYEASILEAHSKALTAVSLDGNHLFTSSQDGTKIWDRNSESVIKQFPESCHLIASTEEHLFCATQNTVKIVSKTNFEILHDWKVCDSYLSGMDISSRFLVTSTIEGLLQLWELSKISEDPKSSEPYRVVQTTCEVVCLKSVKSSESSDEIYCGLYNESVLRWNFQAEEALEIPLEIGLTVLDLQSTKQTIFFLMSDNSMRAIYVENLLSANEEPTPPEENEENEENEEPQDEEVEQEIEDPEEQ